MTLNSDEIAGMRAAIINVQLDHLCDIDRKVQVNTDPNNAPVYVWETLARGEPCHYWESGESELIGTENVTITNYRLVLSANFDINNLDRINKIVNNDGTEIARLMEVRQVLTRMNETVCMLRDIHNG